MPHPRWTGYDLVFFDCDSTLSTIEGIDELARLKGKAGRVGLLTNKAMDGELDLGDVYGKRLRAIKPTRAQLHAIEERYWETLVEDASAVIAVLRRLGVEVFIISGGLIDAVRGFGRRLGVAPDKIRAVELEYNELSGRWWDYHEPSAQQAKTYLDYSEGPLTVSSGKARVIEELARDRTGRRLMIGDGASDLAARYSVDLFVGYGGVTARDKVAAESDIFVRCRSLAAVLPLAVGRGGWRDLRGGEHESLFRKGVDLARRPDSVHFSDANLRERFIQEHEGIAET